MKHAIIMAGILILLLGAAIVGLYLAEVGIQKYERVECGGWAWEASEYEGYYITQWQADQCASYDIEIEAPVQ